MNELKIFENEEFGSIRTTERDGEPWFLASDVCKALEIENTTDALKRLDEDEKSRFNLGLRGGASNVVNEYGLYTLVLASRKPNAKQFKRCITHEVIPSIRKNGGYIANQESMTDEQLMAQALLVAQRTIANRDKQIEEMKPKALLADAITASSTCILMGELAKILRQNGIHTVSIDGGLKQMGQNNLHAWMRENGYLIKKGRTDAGMPTQRSMEMKLFEVKESSYLDGSGVNRITKTMKVTGKGQSYFIGKFLGE